MPARRLKKLLLEHAFAYFIYRSYTRIRKAEEPEWKIRMPGICETWKFNIKVVGKYYTLVFAN